MTKSKEERSQAYSEGARKRNEKYYNKTHKLDDNHEIEKQCSVCNKWLLMTEENFYKNKANKSDGFLPYCIKCTIEKNTNWQHNNKAKAKKIAKTIYMKEETKVKNRERNKKYRDSGKALEYRLNNKEKLKEYRLNRELHKTHTIAKEEWEACKEYFNNCCAYCGLPIEQHYRKYSGKLKQIDLHKEHVCDCGRNDLKNCIPSCQHCNSTKKSSGFNDWYNPSNPTYTYEHYHKICQWIRYDCKKYIMKKKPKKKYTKRNKEYWDNKS